MWVAASLNTRSCGTGSLTGDRRRDPGEGAGEEEGRRGEGGRGEGGGIQGAKKLPDTLLAAFELESIVSRE